MSFGFLADTNVVLYHLTGQLAQPLDLQATAISIITEIELYSFKSLSSHQYQQISGFVATIPVIPLADRIKLHTIAMRHIGLRLPDAAIVGTAIHFGIPLLSHDAALLKIPNATIIAPSLRTS